MRLLLILLSVSLSVFLFASQSFAGSVFYVYKDKSGRTHIEDYIPGELAKYGYKIVNDRGMTIKEVPSVTTKIKKANAKADAKRRMTDKQRAKSEKKKKRQKLLRRFTSLEDIRETGNKKILALQSQIDVTKKHIKAFKKNLSDMETYVASLKSNNKPVPDSQLKDIDRMKENINKNREYIELKRKEQHDVREEFIVFIQEYKKVIAKNND